MIDYKMANHYFSYETEKYIHTSIILKNEINKLNKNCSLYTFTNIFHFKNMSIMV